MRRGVVDYQAAVTMLQAISTTATVPLVRVPWLDPGILMKMLDAAAYCRKEKSRAVNYVKDKWKLEQKVAETVYEQWLSILTPDGKISIKDMQEYFDLAYGQKQISAPINVAAVTDYSLLDQVLAGK